MKEFDEAKFIATYFIVALLTFGYSMNADRVPPTTGTVKGQEVVIHSGFVDTFFIATFGHVSPCSK